MKHGIILAVILSLTVFATAFAEDYDLQKARELGDQGYPAEAQKYLNRYWDKHGYAVEGNTVKASAFQRQGNLFKNRGETIKAVDAFQKALACIEASSDSKEKKVHYKFATMLGLADLHVNNNDCENAAQVAASSVKLMPESTYPYNAVVSCYFSRGDFRAAYPYYQQLRNNLAQNNASVMRVWSNNDGIPYCSIPAKALQFGEDALALKSIETCAIKKPTVLHVLERQYYRYFIAKKAGNVQGMKEAERDFNQALTGLHGKLTKEHAAEMAYFYAVSGNEPMLKKSMALAQGVPYFCKGLKEQERYPVDIWKPYRQKEWFCK